MNTPFRKLSLASWLAALLCCATSSTSSEEPKKSKQRTLTGAQAKAQAGTSILLYQCTAYLKADYVDSVKPANILDGNKLLGSFLGFDGNFAKFIRRDSKQLIVIPQSAILYMVGDEHILNF